jgi:hypothetical protein
MPDKSKTRENRHPNKCNLPAPEDLTGDGTTGTVGNSTSKQAKLSTQTKQELIDTVKKLKGKLRATLSYYQVLNIELIEQRNLRSYEKRRSNWNKPLLLLRLSLLR